MNTSHLSLDLFEDLSLLFKGD